jgi:hypothetical protein
MRNSFFSLLALAVMASLSLVQRVRTRPRREQTRQHHDNASDFNRRAATTISAKAVDLDGDGGNPPVVDTLTLQAGRSYTGRIELLDESVDPPISRTEEIRRDADTHLFASLFFVARKAE